MAITDLLRSLPGILLVGVFPGFAVATLLVRWPWWQRLAAAPGLSAGVVGFVGLVEHDLGVPFTPASVLPPLAVLVVGGGIAGVRRRRRPPTSLAPLGRRETALVVGAALAAGVLSALAIVLDLRLLPLPFATDYPIHATVTERIAAARDVLPVVPIPATGGTTVRPRAAFEATAVVVSWLGGPRPTLALLPLGLASVVLIPLSLATLAVEAGAGWRVAALAPLLALGMPFPRFPIVLGELPLLADSTLVVPLVVAAVRAVRGVDEVRRSAAFVGAAVATVWVLHGLEAITAVVIGGPLLLAAVVGEDHTSVRRLLPLGLAAAVGAGIVTVSTRLPAVLPGHAPPGVLLQPNQARNFTGTLGSGRDAFEVLNVFRAADLVTPLAPFLYLAGLAAALLRRHLRWALVATAIVIGCLADAGYGAHLHVVWDAIFPWATADRLVSIQYWVVPLILAFGLCSAVDLLRSSTARAGPARTLAALAVLATAATGTNTDRSVYALNHDVYWVASSADVAALAAMDRQLPPGSIVLTDPVTDGGAWVTALTRDVEFAPAVYTRNIVDAHGRVVGRDPRAVRVAAACIDPEAASQALRGIDAVFVGSRRRPQTRGSWSAECLRRLPDLVEIGEFDGPSGRAVVFRVRQRPQGG